ncbi:hypothetical protein B0H12DRAFT_758041 [Mycena haematopus]|nr:hypothetical protein B0H12DRAFT_758041 [Mycena haematopus]
MPMPKLLKKLSRKSLRGNDSEAETDADSPPPLPLTEYDCFTEDGHRQFSPPLLPFPSANSSPATSTRPSGDWSHQVMRTMSAGAVATQHTANDSYSGSFSTHSRQASSFAIPSGSTPPRSRATSYSSSDPRARVYSPSQLGYQPPAGSPLNASPSIQQPQIPNDDFSRNLAGAWDIANTAPKVSKTDKLLQVAENKFIQGQAEEGKLMAIETGVVAALTTVGGMEVIEQGLHTFMDGIPVLMNALDEVAKLHPFIGVAVMAFKAVWALEEKRRANDKMILSLHMEMKDMMSVLTQLKNVKDAEEVAPDGSTIRGRMQDIVKGTADDIKSCANVCDTYSKKKTVVKVLKGPIWEGKLVKFVGIFTKRRGDFEFALSIHTALGVDAANRAISAVDKTTQEMNAKMDLMMKMFSQFVTPEQKEMARLVEQKGGLQACQDNDKVLKELNELEQKSGAAPRQGPTSAKGSASATNSKSGLEDLKDDLMTDIDDAIAKNMTAFDRKFEVQTRQIIDEMSKVVERQGDRIIGAITAGPHDKIVDPDVHEIWKEMGWRGSVKSRHFVMALRDHYQEGGEEAAAKNDNHHEDDWALLYLTVSRLQPISEAFDDDASSFISITEANTFTAARPLDWSLKKWLAFWAIGWHQSMAHYVGKIKELLAKMFALRLHVLPANRVSVNKYLDSIHHGVTTLHSGLNPCYINEGLQEKFTSYIESEEARLRGNLEAISYDIDAINTLYLITGQGRIERFLLPLIFLLLERHFQILRACQSKIVHPDELWDAADTMEWAIVAGQERVDLLESNFKQQKVDMKQQFKTFAHGLFQYMHDPHGLWAPKLVLAQDDVEYPYDDSLEPQVDFYKVLNFPLDTDRLDFDAYTPAPRAKKVATRPAPALRALLGTWNGFTYSHKDETVPSSGMLSFDLSATGNLTFGASAQRANMSEFNIAANVTPNISTSSNSHSSKPSPLGSRLFILLALGIFPHSPLQERGERNPILVPMTAFSFSSEWRRNALWQFAIAAVRYGVRRGAWSWSFFEQRGQNRRRFIELYIRKTRFGRPLTRKEEDELGLLQKSFTTADSRFYHSIAEDQIRKTTDHDVSCDACKGHIGGSRVTCLTCRLEETFDTVDFCDNPTCMYAKVIPTGMTRPHLPTHDIFKVRRNVHTRQFGKTYRQAQEALKKARAFFPDPQDEKAEPLKSALDAPRCAVCRRAVTQPCWFCVQCEDPRFICMACEGKKNYSFLGHDLDTHDLVRCTVLVEAAEVALEERLVDLESRLEKHQAYIDTKLQSMELKMEERLSQLDGRLSGMESLLRELIYTIGPGQRTKTSALPAYPQTAPSYIESYP